MSASDNMDQAKSSPAKRRKSGPLRAVVDYGGLAVFVAVYFLTGKDMIKANWALAAASGVALAIGVALERRVAPMPLITGLFALVFAALAQRFHDTTFVKMQPTAIDLFLGAVMLGGAAMKRNPLKALLGSAIHMDAPAWRILMIRYGCLFLITAAVNEALWRTQSEQTWVVWHRPILLALSILFSLSQIPFLIRHAQLGESAEAEAEDQTPVQQPPD
ncbi:MAG TPA: septation protein IspZ [Caulobacteraceae bacterium]|nr:septation protein IspZ [Caulobacteraceae bacterium]